MSLVEKFFLVTNFSFILLCGKVYTFGYNFFPFFKRKFTFIVVFVILLCNIGRFVYEINMT